MSRSKPLNIDIHQHFVPEGYFDAVRSDPETYGAKLEGQHFHLRSGMKFRWDPRQREPKLRLADMDKGRVDVAVLSILPPFFSYAEPIEVGKRICTLINDGLSEIVRDNGGRLLAMGHVPLQDVPAAVAELRRAVDELGMAGALLPANGLKGHLGAKEYWPIYAEAERLGCALSIHGGSGSRLGL